MLLKIKEILPKFNFAIKIGRIYFVIFILGKLALVAAAYITARSGVVLSHALLQKQLNTTQIEIGAENIKKKLSLGELKQINSRNIFGKEEAPTKPAENTVASKELKMRLVATSVTKNRSPFAILEDQKNNNEQDVFEIEQVAFSRAKVIEITADYVKLNFNNSIEILRIDINDNSANTAENDAPIDDSQTEFVLDESEINDNLANLPRLLADARAVPYFRNGESVGMRLFAIRQGSIYEKLGLKNGDIINFVNNQSVADPSQAIKLFEDLKTERSIGVKLERNGEIKSFNYSIR